MNYRLKVLKASAVNEHHEMKLAASTLYCIAAAATALLSAPVLAFVPTCGRGSAATAASIQAPYTWTPSSPTQRCATLLSDDWVYSAAAQQILIATIDSDVANIPENEFASVFAGGILVMFGGLFSALIVGFIVEKRDLYANIVAESYAQGGDEEFWKGLSEEEKKKAESLLQQFRESKEEGVAKLAPEPVAALSEETEKGPIAAKPTASESAKAAPILETKQIGMFSDYGDD